MLYVGQAYYNAWYLSRELRKLGWKADVLNWDSNPASQIYYHGEDFRLDYDGPLPALRHLGHYLRWISQYDIFHFSNAHGMQLRHPAARRRWPSICAPATRSGCSSGSASGSSTPTTAVSTASRRRRSRRGASARCATTVRGVTIPSICSDERNLTWGAFRNSIADYQILLGGNRIDYNLDPRVHEEPEFYCLDEEFWHPQLAIPAELPAAAAPNGTVKIYHAVGNATSRSEAGTMRNLKSSHIYLPLIEQLKREGFDIELMFFENVPNRDLRYYQVQADIFVDMLTVRVLRRDRARGDDARQAGRLLPAGRSGSRACAPRSRTTSTSCRSSAPPRTRSATC